MGDKSLKATKEQFEMFLIIRKTNKVNMMDQQVKELCEATKEQHYDMCFNFDKYEVAMKQGE